MKRLLLTAAVVLSLAGFTTVKPTPSVRRAAARGRQSAARDIALGHLMLKTYGMLPAGNSPYAQLVEERLGVRTVSVGACMVSPELIAETAAYNKAMEKEIEKRFGPHTLDQLRQEASGERASRPQ